MTHFSPLSRYYANEILSLLKYYIHQQSFIVCFLSFLDWVGIWFCHGITLYSRVYSCRFILAASFFTLYSHLKYHCDSWCIENDEWIIYRITIPRPITRFFFLCLSSNDSNIISLNPSCFLFVVLNKTINPQSIIHKTILFFAIHNLFM